MLCIWPHHLGDRRGRIRDEVEDEPGDHRVIAVARHREGTRVAHLEADARIGDAALRDAEEFGRGIDAHDRERVGDGEDGVGQGAGAAADVDPPTRRGGREPGEECLRKGATPSSYIRLIGIGGSEHVGLEHIGHVGPSAGPPIAQRGRR
jgi:hypothetical protein